MPADRPAQRVQCFRCLDVVWTSHPWEEVTCACGAVAVSGIPWRPRVDWRATSAGGWSFVDDVADPGPMEDAADVDIVDDTSDAGTETGPGSSVRISRPAGFRARR